jgi:hypothetical protein
VSRKLSSHCALVLSLLFEWRFVIFLLSNGQDGVSYVGKTVSEEFSAAPPCRYLLGVYNKDNGQLQVPTFPPKPAHNHNYVRYSSHKLFTGLFCKPSPLSWVLFAMTVRHPNQRRVALSLTTY